MENQDTEILFAKRIMELMDEALDIILNFNYDNEETIKRKYNIIKDLSSLTAEVLKKKDIQTKMKEVAESSEVDENSTNIDDKFNTFKMIRNVINHFPIFKSWDEVYISKDLLTWNDSSGDQIESYFKKEREFSYIIYLNEYGKWVPKKTIEIRTPKLGKYNKIYLKDILSLDDAIWTFSIIDYYLQFLGLQIETRFLISA